jgi:transcriptional regulator GlxA family with amidase domain
MTSRQAWTPCSATTHWVPSILLDSLQAGVTVERAHRIVDDEIVSSAGVASGIDMAFYASRAGRIRPSRASSRLHRPQRTTGRCG